MINLILIVKPFTTSLNSMENKFSQSASKEEIEALNKSIGTSGKAFVREVISGDYFKLHKTAGKD